MARNRQGIPKAEREAELLTQARILFAAKGYRGTSVAEVGRACGIASAAVHWYFPTKDDLFAAVLDQIFEEARSGIDAAGGSPRDELEKFLSASARYRVLHREAYERMEQSEAMRAVYSRVMQWLAEQLLRAISMRLPEGTDTDLISDTAHVMFEGLLISVRRVDRPVGEFLDMLIDVLTAAAVRAEQAVPLAPAD